MISLKSILLELDDRRHKDPFDDLLVQNYNVQEWRRNWLWLRQRLQKALPAICEHFDRYPDDDAPVSDEEHRQLTELVVRYVRVSEALLRYATQVGGKPCRN